jgi:hypothetical protein
LEGEEQSPRYKISSYRKVNTPSGSTGSPLIKLINKTFSEKEALERSSEEGVSTRTIPK